ncbi:cleavage stimulation factor subunit 1 [Brachionus plicatilis]|uniref:Cleavage stimulation factor 50 kDa subunit n=1 Tax=Brachionus plicatilis TaxID=10195 RepID=A0A3M7SMG7_BRAPC|nr:cleavage stimulation factor subunit 1 [Brachionus plicatilis]
MSDRNHDSLNNSFNSNDKYTKNDVKFRENLYRLIVSQLFYDGYQHVAVGLSAAIQANPPCPPSNRLLNLIKNVLQNENFNLSDSKEDFDYKKIPNGDNELSGLDFDYESDKIPTSSDASLYETCYVTSHKAPCRAAAFDPQGTVIATGSVDASIKILDIERMLAKSSLTHDQILTSDQTGQLSAENHPVIRTLYDHADEITTLAFHPFEPILVSGSRDYTVKFFEYAKPSTKKAFKTIQESEQIRCISFHPNGDWLLVSTQHPTLRLYKVETSQCFVSSNPNDQHKLAVTSVEWSPNARVFATASKDGSIKLWDSVSNRCINTFADAHGHQEVCSVQFSKNSKYLLSSGKDSVVRLWELSTARCLIAYTGAGSAGKQEKRTQAIFNHTEDYIFYPDEKTTTLCCWDSRNAERQKLLALGHNGVVKCIVHSTNMPQFITCSDDFRARFWSRRTLLGE